MQRRHMIGFLGSAIAAGTVLDAAGAAKERIVGDYRLAKVIRRTADGQETVVNANPNGHVSYEKSGRIWILLVAADRKKPADPRNVTSEEYKEMARGLMAYVGTFEVDEPNQKLIIHIKDAANPALNGTTIERAFTLTDSTLTMIVPGNTQTLNVFERLPE